MKEISLPEAFNIISSATEPEFRHTNESSYMVYQSLIKIKEVLQNYDRINSAKSFEDNTIE